MQQQILNTPSVHAGYLYLARMFCRLVKEAVDLARKLKGEVSRMHNKLLYIQDIVPGIKCATGALSKDSLIESDYTFLLSQLQLLVISIRGVKFHAPRISTIRIFDYNLLNQMQLSIFYFYLGGRY